MNETATSAKLREWSSLIGIVTAIVGNILISFALNIQRYAHIRLGHEQEKNNERWGLSKSEHRSYGTEQSKIAEERAQFNLKAPAEGERTAKYLDSVRGDSNGGPGNEVSIHSRSSSDSTTKQSEKPTHQDDRKSYLKSPYWWAGIILMICGEAGNFIAYGFAPASIVSPLGVVALVSNCVIAPVLLNERFRPRDFWGVAVAIVGAVTIVLSARGSETKMGPDDVWAAITRWEFETYLGITAALMVVLMWASGSYGEKSILIDLGLVALFGMLIRITITYDADKHVRGLYSPVHERCRISFIGYSLASPNFPHHLSARLHTCCHGTASNTICEPSATTLRLYPGHPSSVRPLHNLCHYRKRYTVQRLPICGRFAVWEVLRRLCPHVHRSVPHH